jgi:HlyD family secretion protein
MKVRLIGLFLLLALGLAACGSKATATPLPTVALENGATSSATAKAPPKSAGVGSVAASGIVIPESEAQMAFISGGNVQAVNVAVGDQVSAGKVLAELDNTTLQLDLAQAQRNLAELTSPSALAATEQAIATARQNVKDTQDKVDGIFYPRASDTLIKKTQADIDLAKQTLSRAADAYRQVARREDGDTQKAQALRNLTSAQLYLDSLVANYNWYTSSPTEIDKALITANLAAAKATLQEEEWYLAALKGETLPPEATGKKLAQLHQAQDNLAAAQERLANSRLVAPCDGTVATVEIVVGEFAAPGKIVLILSKLTPLLVETTDLSERDVPQVKIGQTVNVFVEAIGANLPGTVKMISPTSETLGGDVVYKTTIELQDLPEGLRPGMSAEVQFEAAP